MEKYALALAGGGAKGIYQIGAWKALKELDIVYEAVAGTSIGAINGAFMAEDNIEKATEMWMNLEMDQCIRLPEETELSSDNLMERKHAGIILRELLAHGGIDQSPFYELLSKYIDPKAVYDSSIDYGLCTYSLTTGSTVKLWRKDIPPQQFFSYLLASSAFPGLRQVKLDNQLYVDGGLGDNLPFDMLRSRGLRNIIAIDMRTPKNRKVQTDRLRITHICNSLDLGAVLDLTPCLLLRNYNLGYLDTKKAFGFFDGLHYYLPVEDYQKLLKFWGTEALTGFEQAALIYDMPRDEVYRAEEFLDNLKVYRQKANDRYLAERQKLNAEGIITAVKSGSLLRLKKMPSAMRLQLLLELMTEFKQNGSRLSIPLTLFKDVDAAAESLMKLI